MRFRFYPVFLLGFGLFTQHSHAAETLLPASAVAAASAVGAASSAPDNTIYIEAQEIKGMKDEGTEAHGKVELRQADQKIFADHVFYKQKTGDLSAYGSVRLEQRGGSVSGPDLKMNSYTSVSQMTAPEFQIKQNKSRGSASMMRSSDKLHYEYENARYTTCPPGNDDWFMNMSWLEIDRESQIGTAHNAWVEFKGVPFLYTPWVDFPLDGRHSGFLGPIWGSTPASGSEFTLPYYLNIAPNYDATISPRVMDKRGTQFNDEFRYMGDSYSGEVHYDVLSNDRLAKMDRTHTSLTHTQDLGNGLGASVKLNRVSDDAYFRDLSTTAASVLQTQLLNEGVMTYGAGWWSGSVRVQTYQTLQNPLTTVITPYQRMPQINLSAQKTLNDDFEDVDVANEAVASKNAACKDAKSADAACKDIKSKEGVIASVEVQHPTVINVTSEYVDFVHPTKVNGQRMVVYPSMTYALLNDSGYYLKPKFGVHSTQYVMDINNSSNIPDTTRTLPIFSLDGGMTFERDMTLGKGEYVQTLEPRAFYVKIPYQDQSFLPVYDTSQAGFTFAQMFSENRFYGNDRVGDANMMTVALTSRLIDNEGGVERLRVAVGQRFSYEAPLVNLVAPSANSQSDILLAVGGRATNALTLDSLLQYDPNAAHVLSYNATSRYRPETGKVLNLGYRYSRVDGTSANDLRQADFSTQWPLFWRWDLVSRWIYSWTEPRQVVEQMVGLEYNAQCWAFRLLAQKFPVPGQQVSTSLFIQLELNDLVAVGSNPLSTLRLEIPGYTKLNDTKQP